MRSCDAIYGFRDVADRQRESGFRDSASFRTRSQAAERLSRQGLSNPYGGTADLSIIAGRQNYNSCERNVRAGTMSGESWRAKQSAST